MDALIHNLAWAIAIIIVIVAFIIKGNFRL